MKGQIENAIDFVTNQDVKGCITGSCLLDYFENQDVDVFLYNEKSFTKLLYTLHHNPMFTILDPKEEWKFNRFTNHDEKIFKGPGINTIKFTYNTCIDVNLVLKRNCTNIFSVLESFDMDIICKGYDIKSKQYLDLTNGSTITKVASWNKWNPAYISDEIWRVSRILRQLERCFKYYKRGYNTDPVVLKYLEIMGTLEKYESIFDSELFNEKLGNLKENIVLTKGLCNTWLENHSITEDETKLLKEIIKQF